MPKIIVMINNRVRHINAHQIAWVDELPNGKFKLEMSGAPDMVLDLDPEKGRMLKDMVAEKKFPLDTNEIDLR